MNYIRYLRFIKPYLAGSLVLQVFIILFCGGAWAETLPEKPLDSESSYEKESIDDFTQMEQENEPFVETDFQSVIQNTSLQKLIISQGSNRTTPTPPEQQTPTPQPQPQPPLGVPTQPVPSQPSVEIPGNITVTKFEFEGNTAFSQEKLRKVTEGFLNRPLSFAELLQVEAVITKLYTDSGYVNSGAVITADQALTPQGAVVKVRIVEGGIEDIKVSGTRRLNPEYVRSRIGLGASTPLNRDRLVEALQLLQIDPLIQNVSAELSTGSRPERSLLEVRVTEADSFRTEFFADNGRSPSVGSFRRGVRVNQGNLLGFGDGFDFRYTNTDGSNAFDIGYSIPLNPNDGTLTLAGGVTSTEVVKPPFDRVDITGDSFYVDIGYRQPILRTPTQELALGLTLSRQQSKTQLLGENFPLSIGADANGETRLSTIRFFQEYTKRDSQQVLALRSQFNLGVGFLGSTINEVEPDSRFFSWRGQGQYVRLLAPDMLLVLRSDIQLATTSLVPLEQFGLGGLQSVRGYRQDFLLTDNGFLGSAEVRLPVFRVPEVQGILQVVPFVDFGFAWNSGGGSSPDPNALVGIGLGLQWQMGRTLNARVDYGWGLSDVRSSGDRTLQEDGWYFSINYSPF
ncbi:MAG: ShlB/FhaC/HecB family hemolysin secretion/activation protein [Scytonematopsis contorta HA4267-MV1]|jgi:hemolysin activation/secretion protein|nr:ShlB/FhaC/HecB family hemolysin secretion/activation protein [Scytonematopsis contorta HA4267-MV1]